ncbi:MAG: dipeptidyl aminopeptidase/acylaminoacyl peptidase [Myxococcota bacterium]|jgi:dipeptidyl aminopeptidase/acylaminoacyl peptidase
MRAPRIRSDATIDYLVIDANGEQTQTARFKQSGMRDMFSTIDAPHLQRLSPDGRTLAAFSADTSTLTLLSMADGSMRSITVNRLHTRKKSTPGSRRVQTIRWLNDNQTIIFQSQKAIQLVNVATKRVRTVLERKASASQSVVDTRVVGHGFIARTPHEVFFVRIAGGQPEITNITPEGRTVSEANVRSDGRIVIVANPNSSMGVGHELITFSTAIGEPRFMSSRPCAGTCHITNWAPGSERLAYALANGTIVLEAVSNTAKQQSGPGTEVRLELPVGHGRVSALWMNHDGTRLLAANDHSLAVWNSAGRRLWTWTPKSGPLRSAHFGDDGSVIAAVKGRILRVSDGVASDLIAPKKLAALLAGPGTSRLDDVFPLPSGGVAFAIIRDLGPTAKHPLSSIPLRPIQRN